MRTCPQCDTTCLFCLWGQLQTGWYAPEATHWGPAGPKLVPHCFPWPSSPRLPVAVQVRMPDCATRVGIGGDSQIPLGSHTGGPFTCYSQFCTWRKHSWSKRQTTATLLCLCYICGCSITSDDLSSSNQVLMTSKYFLRQQLGPVHMCEHVCSCTNSHSPIAKQLPCWPDSMQHIRTDRFHYY